MLLACMDLVTDGYCIFFNDHPISYLQSKNISCYIPVRKPTNGWKMEPEHYQKWFAEAWAEGKGETRGFLTQPEVFYEFLKYPRFIFKP